MLGGTGIGVDVRLLAVGELELLGALVTATPGEDGRVGVGADGVGSMADVVDTGVDPQAPDRRTAAVANASSLCPIRMTTIGSLRGCAQTDGR